MDEATKNLTLARKILEKGFGGSLDILDDIVPEHFTEHQYGMSGTRDGLKRAINSLHSAFEDLSYSLIDSVTSGDKVWLNYRATGTHTGIFMGKEATGKTFEITVIDIMRFKNGQMVEHWGVPDRLGLLQQLDLFGR